jgi:hypothetical protein
MNFFGNEVLCMKLFIRWLLYLNINLIMQYCGDTVTGEHVPFAVFFV